MGSKRSLYAFAPNTNKWLDVLGLNKNLSAPYWPPNRGALGEVRSITLPVGTLVDRYGYSGGTFVFSHIGKSETHYLERTFLLQMKFHVHLKKQLTYLLKFFQLRNHP